MAEDRKRLYASEREALMRVNIMVALGEEIQRDLGPRARMVKGLPMLVGQMASLPPRILTGILSTVPAEQLPMIARNLQSACYTTGVRRPGNHVQHDDFGVWISYNQFNVIFEALHDHCLVCELDPQVEKQCPLRKTLDQLGVDLDHDAGRCAYRFRM